MSIPPSFPSSFGSIQRQDDLSSSLCDFEEDNLPLSSSSRPSDTSSTFLYSSKYFQKSSEDCEVASSITNKPKVIRSKVTKSLEKIIGKSLDKMTQEEILNTLNGREGLGISLSSDDHEILDEKFK